MSVTQEVAGSSPVGPAILPANYLRQPLAISGGVAELERSLIAERVRAGLRNAKGKRLGRPKVIVDAARTAALRAQGLGWKKIAVELGIVGTVLRATQDPC